MPATKITHTGTNDGSCGYVDNFTAELADGTTVPATIRTSPFGTFVTVNNGRQVKLNETPAGRVANRGTDADRINFVLDTSS